MRKLRLDMEDLQVESFTTGVTQGPRGTVRAKQGTLQVDTCAVTDYTCGFCVDTDPTAGGDNTQYTCTCPDHNTCAAGCQATQAPQETCYDTCPDTGAATCAKTCDPTCNSPSTCWFDCTEYDPPCASALTCYDCTR